MKPQMSRAEVLKIKDILSKQRSPVSILEWGSGGSTVYFTEFLSSKNISYTWTSLEYNKVWYDQVFNKVKDNKNVNLVLFDVGNTELKQRSLPMDEYVFYPSTLEKKYDIIFVDGRKRRRCLMESLKLLKPDGLVLLHDARRTYYHSAFSFYPDGQILLWSGLWQGRIKNPGFIRRFVNFIMYWCFRMYTFSFRLRFIFK